MPRIARVVAVGVPHHVTQRGNNRQQVFFAGSQQRNYLALLSERADRHQLRVLTAVQICWAEQRRLLKTREKASPKGCSGDQVAALDKIEIMLLSQLGLHSRQ